MKLSRSFLDSLVDTCGISNLELADKMTNVGNEYEEIRGIATGTNLVIGEVLECDMHPNSDHLHVCKVSVGSEVLNIVCGAPNVKAGIKVIVALSGAVLPGGVIKKGVIRGEESNGMLCSLAEIGLDSKFVTEEDKLGIHILGDDAVVGTSALEYLGFDDTTIDFELTSNRSDLLSVLGMAYEVGAILNTKAKEPAMDYAKSSFDDKVSLSVLTDNCPMYLARVVKNVTIGPSPLFIRTRLMASGIRPINNVVDISNYVMLELGQPLHFFDYETLGNKIIVRMAKDGEELTTLDGVLRTLSSDDIVIANDNGPVALAGVMGGLNSEIEPTTKDVVIESAIFNPVNIRKTSRKILSSEASTRFERGLDPKRCLMALDRACYLLEKYAGGEVSSSTVKHDLDVAEEKIIVISKDKIEKILGLSLTNDDVCDVFDRLCFPYKREDDLYTVYVPSRRLDISIEEDLIEEVGRIHGINNIVGKLPTALLKPGRRGAMEEVLKDINTHLVGLGLKEVITYSLVSDSSIDSFKDMSFTPYEVLRPISSDKKYMRYSLIPSLINVYNYNASRKINDVSIFELSEVYVKDSDDNMLRYNKCSILITGLLTNNKLYGNDVACDFYVLKGILESLLDYLGYHGRYSYDTTSIIKELHPYSSCNVLVDREYIGYIGKLSPAYTKKDIYVLELNLTKLKEKRVKPIRNKEISKYPLIKKDVAFILDKDVLSSSVVDVIKKAGGALLKDIEVFDIYYGDNIGSNKKSIAYSLTFSSNDKTLEDSTVDKIFRDIISQVTSKLKAEIRDK